MRLLVTGGAGFIGSNFVRHMLAEHADCHIVNLDKLTYAGNLENLQGLEADPHYRFERGDIAEPADVERAVAAAKSSFGGLDAIVNFAAESHVDRSIEDPQVFIRTNVQGTQVLLDAARRHGVGRFLQVSTDEVYGTLGEEGHWTEGSPLEPNSPYSASKAGADLLVRAYGRTYGLPVLMTRCSNNYGPYQFPEKLIPLCITNALEGKPIPVYGTGENVRDWIHVEDHCRAVDLVLRRGRPGEVYNVAGENEWRNLDIVRAILRELGKPDQPGEPGCPIRFVTDRPGHDWRYAMGSEKLRRELGWERHWTFEEGLRQTVRWYLDNRAWWERVKSGAYQAYYERMYAGR